MNFREMVTEYEVALEEYWEGPKDEATLERNWTVLKNARKRMLDGARAIERGATDVVFDTHQKMKAMLALLERGLEKVQQEPVDS